MKLEKGIPLIDQHDENGYWGGKFGGNQIAESLNYPIEELTSELEKKVIGKLKDYGLRMKIYYQVQL